MPVVNQAGQDIHCIYVQGPVLPPGTEDESQIKAYRPLPQGGVHLEPNESKFMMLLPGRYHFAVSYLGKPRVANSMWFEIPQLPEDEADDGQLDQTITITTAGAFSDDPITDDSLSDFPGNQLVGSTNLRPVVDCSPTTVPAGIGINPISLPTPPTLLVSPAELGTIQALSIGPMKVEQLQQGDGLSLSVMVKDPEGSALKCFWSVFGDPLAGIRTVRVVTAASGSTITYNFKRTRAGVYTVYLTAYDNLMLFNEVRWSITVIPNARPYIDVVLDDTWIDFGRRDNWRSALGIGNDPGTPPQHPALPPVRLRDACYLAKLEIWGDIGGH